MGSNEMIFVPSQAADVCEVVGQDYHAPGPKIAYSYQHDPKATPIRKISKSSLVNQKKKHLKNT